LAVVLAGVLAAGAAGALAGGAAPVELDWSKVLSTP